MSGAAVRAGRIIRAMVAAEAKQEAGALARMGRVCHWAGLTFATALLAVAALSAVGLVVRAASFALSATQYPPWPVGTEDWAELLIYVAPAIVLTLTGRALRYIFSGE